jgi:folate-dependent phosphoribosylglycinamide formyltransferase PurN
MVWQARERGIQSAGPTLGLSFVAERLLTGSVWFVAKVEVLPWFTDRIETNQKRVYLSEHDDKPNTMETVVSKELLQANLMGALSLGVSIRWGDFQ